MTATMARFRFVRTKEGNCSDHYENCQLLYTDFYPIIGHKIQTQYTTGTTFFRITLVEYGKIYH